MAAGALSFNLKSVTSPSLLLILLFLLASAAPLYAAPSPISRTRLASRDAFSGPNNVTIVTSTTDSNGNPATQTCLITFTAQNVNGQDQVVMVESCTVTSGAPPPPPPVTSVSGSSSTAATTSTAAATSSSATAAASSSSSASSAATTTTSASAASSSPASSSSSSTASASGAASTSSASPSSSTTPASSSSNTATSTASASSSSSTPSAAESATSAKPTEGGRTISILPIGLGVFAGLSVIALLVVGAVTYERTKYRKAFRARKLAEAGGAMGYGGMANRV